MDVVNESERADIAGAHAIKLRAHAQHRDHRQGDEPARKRQPPHRHSGC